MDGAWFHAPTHAHPTYPSVPSPHHLSIHSYLYVILMKLSFIYMVSLTFTQPDYLSIFSNEIASDAPTSLCPSVPLCIPFTLPPCSLHAPLHPLTPSVFPPCPSASPLHLCVPSMPLYITSMHPNSILISRWSLYLTA